MSDTYYGIWGVVTNLLPNLAITIIFSIILVGIAIHLMRNPNKY